MPDRDRAPLSPRRRSTALGFTLIEVLMVVAVLSILAGVVVPQVTGTLDDAKNAAVLHDLQELTMAIERYRMDHAGLTPDLIQNDTLAQLLTTTDADGNLGVGPQYPYGPYLPGAPKNALNGVTRVFRISTTPPADLANRVGWVYHPDSGQVWAGLFPQFVDLATIQSDGSAGGS